MHPDSDALPPPKRRPFRNPARASDPRTIVTPDAFAVHPDLLGVPLAQHSRRIGAVLLDLLLIALLTRAGGLLLGLLAGLFFFRMAFKRKREEPPSAMRTAFRGTVGCFGSIILLITAVVLWGAVRDRVGRIAQSDRGDRVPAAEVVQGGAPPGLGDVLAGFGEWRELQRAASPAEARAATEALARRMFGAGLEPDDVREAIVDIVPGGSAWRDSVPRWTSAVLAAQVAERTARADAAAAGADTLPLVDALERYSALLRRLDEAGEADDEASEALATLRTRIAPALSADTLAVLESRLSRERGARARAESALEEARAESGLRAFLRRIADDLGLGIGWAALYFSVFLSWWNGLTPAKRIFRIRVVRLDRSPITWWIAFERYGGYAAGFATGLLGFAQVYWDPNRQAIHDRIAGTIVIQDGKPPVPGRWRHMVQNPPAPPTHGQERAP